MLMAGLRWDDLSLRDRLDVAYAAQIEPFTHGSTITVDRVIELWDGILADVMPDRESFGLSAAAEEAARRTEEMWPAARPRAAPPTVAPNDGDR